VDYITKISLLFKYDKKKKLKLGVLGLKKETGHYENLAKKKKFSGLKQNGREPILCF